MFATRMCHFAHCLRSTCLLAKSIQTSLSKLALVGGQPLVLAGRALHQEGGDLHLADAVEGGHADVGSWQGLGAGSNLILDLASIGAAEHGQLPHHPVAVVVVALRK